METNLSQLSCGNCGADQHILYMRLNGELIAECHQCKSKTEIITNNPKIILRNIEGLGTLCIFD